MSDFDLILKGGRVLDPSQGLDAAVLSFDKGSFTYSDVLGETLDGEHKLNFKGVVIGGKWWHPT